MLNKTGYGTLYFGVKNDGTIIGQEIGVMTLKSISQAIANFIKPQIIPTILVEFIEDTTIVKVEVKGDNKPYSAYGRYYINHQMKIEIYHRKFKAVNEKI
ncbi:MAG: ATP-binding protein [Bacilli bacterium]